MKLSQFISNKKIRDFAYTFFVVLGRIKTFFRLSSNSAHATSSLDHLDALIQLAHSFEHFFAQPDLVDAYYSELREYFGDRFPRGGFDGICGQIKEICKTRPDFGKNLWTAPCKRTEFKISTVGDSAGRTVNRTLWRIYWMDYCLSVDGRSYLAEVPNDVDRKRKIISELKAHANLVRDFQVSKITAGAQGLSRREREFLDREFFKTINTRPEFQKAVASLVGLFFAQQENRQVIYLSDADLLLYFLKDLRQNPRKILAIIPECPNPDGLLGAIRSCLPNVRALTHDLDLFPHKFVKNTRGTVQAVGRNSISEFKTIRIHPLHALWLGVPGNDCLGGHSETLTPARWLVSASEASQAHVIEKNGVYQGFTRCTPVHDSVGKTYGSLEIWSPVMIKSILVGDQAMKPRLREQSFFDVWFPQYAAQLPKSWRGIILSESVLIDNLGVKSIITGSQFYRNSKLLGPATNFRFADLEADAIAREFSTDDIRKRYGDGVIFDASIQDAGSIRLLSLH